MNSRQAKLSTLYWQFRNRLTGFFFKEEPAEKIFTSIFEKNSWRGKDSVSGTGSDVYQTQAIMQELPLLFAEFKISSLLDIPCGDFHWMQNIDLTHIKYIGADIVDELIQQNIRYFGISNVHFEKLDIIQDSLPSVDLIFCRDCLVHFSYDDIYSALENICNSQSKYLLATTFTARSKNFNIHTGQWRALNLQAAPFSLPQPVKIMDEQCTESNGAFADKALALWDVDQIRNRLGN